jgi:hypothetical protein
MSAFCDNAQLSCAVGYLQTSVRSHDRSQLFHHLLIRGFTLGGVNRDDLGIAQGLDVTQRRLAEEMALFASELAHAFVADLICHSAEHNSAVRSPCVGPLFVSQNLAHHRHI